MIKSYVDVSKQTIVDKLLTDTGTVKMEKWKLTFWTLVFRRVKEGRRTNIQNISVCVKRKDFVLKVYVESQVCV